MGFARPKAPSPLRSAGALQNLSALDDNAHLLATNQPLLFVDPNATAETLHYYRARR